MKITTLENSDRRFELSDYERDILVQVATYIHNFFDDLEFSIRHFTKDQAQTVRSILEDKQGEDHQIISKEQTELIFKVFKEAENFVSDLIYDSKIDDNEDFETTCGDLFDILFENLTTQEEIEEFKKKMNS